MWKFVCCTCSFHKEDMFQFSRRILARQQGGKTRFSSATAETTTPSPTPTPPVPAVDKGTRLEQWKKFWTVLYSDYRDVAVDTITSMKAKPKKAAAYLTGIGCVLYATETNPDARTYYEAMVKAADDAILVSEANLNPATDNRLCLIRQSYNEGTVRCLSLGLFSLIWLANYHQDCGIYPSQCKYLKPGIIGFHKRIIDVGFLGQWWNIHWYMKDFDINHNEFSRQ
ncbi:Uncharacterized protein APZ42_017745 [Daphnia magna]|uniref:Mitochondrial import inner membrane translocase subunit Tim29 n=1 Tax=Daphnia magna TaxID=35525 RepID=A0A164ZM53_9CRUS|nr:Uncharacterized protein APZ42_017745 [Daphnia magna]